ncbi:response regulator [Bacteroides ovatus]|jgi:signal transduction histidine kinase/DNA-binding response OmpR family regulator/ligand-binding sensor domain-containing protein|uniref:histidine kinase n=2 Tax=Bacteroides TaxID=816 RepID=A0A5M5E4K0_BACOV|nr:two-component regulator propeller domain-containing protein [Bacteroides sp. 1_1_30]KAA4011702.1 response regulator [Bacteroides ovatus]KAA4012056.1 response regulator [Bacteroides ovatus]KAA4020794.1 response regulator [Bacteroides ovatus]KAA4030880.1 response regulator [Bacteroides ovatus]KAA4036701.1 response regulator [Bacteroides ovatus]
MSKAHVLKRYSFLIWILFFVLSTKAEQQDYYFRQISLEQGLSQSRVQCIYRDHQGVIWIGTKWGLNSYDQSELKSYFHDREQPNSLPDNFIRFITEDRLGDLYVSTNKGIAIYNKAENQFQPLKYNGKPFNAWSYLQIGDNFLFGGEETLYQYNLTDKSITTIFPDIDGDKLKCINRIFQWSPDVLITSSKKDGLWMYDLIKKKMYRCPFVKEREINTIFVDSQNRLWVSFYGKGIACYSKEGKRLFSLSTKNSGLNNDIIFDFLEKDNQLWIATDGGGINILDFQTMKFSHLKHISDDEQSLPNNSIYRLYKDQMDNIWIGSIHGGLFAIKKVFIKTYKDVPLNNPNGISERTVVSIFEDKDTLLWIGTDGGGINSFDQKTNTFHHYPTTYGEKVTSITNFSENELLLSCFNKGVFTFNKRTAQMQPFPIINDSISKREFSSGDLVNLYATKDNIYILGAKVYIYNKHTRQTSILYAPQIDIQRQIAMQAIYSDDTHLYLMGTNNLFKLNFKTNELSSLVNMKEGDDFTSACRDDKGNFWIGSNFGLLFYNKQTGKTEKIHTNLFNSVSSLAYDKKGKVWIGAQNMFFAYIINEKRFVILDESDGVPSNELIFTPIPALRTPNLYMGGTMGLVRINTDIIFESNSSPILKLLEVKLNGKSTLKQVNNNCISIPWNHSSFNIKVIADEKNSFRKHLFRYVITGKDKMVIESYLQTLELGTLASGEYTISVSCDTSNGEWSQPTEILTIIVSPPWWKSTWFIILCIFFAFLVAGMVFFSLIRKKENRLKREMREHEKKIYEEKIRFLINISHELRTPLTLIYASLKRILNKEVKQDELSEYLQGAFKQANQMKDIINIVLDARKMEVGQEVLHISSHPLHKWIQEVAETFQTASKAKEIEITYDFDDSIQSIAYDDTKCKVVLSNLIMNALKYSPNQTRIVIKTIRTNESIQVHVQDQGIGLDNVDIKKLFTRFYQGKHNEGGSGIGLSYAKMLIDLHGGRMGAFNNKDRGATFFYEIPANLQEQEVSCPQHSYLNELLSSPEEEEKIESGSFSLQGYSLLIVEDKQDLREFLRNALKDKFKKIYQAENGLVALEVIKQQQPDIIVSDVMMPQMNGYQLCKEIKENLNISHIPVILLTARADSESQMLGYKLGADAYLPKPFEMEMLLSVIQNQMRNREYIKSRYRGNQFILSPQEATFSNADEQFMIKLNEMIDQNLSQPDLDVKFLTAQMAMSRTSLYNKIKELTGMGANDYINRRRIDKAIILLTQSDMSITEISEQVGFTYQRYFSTLFKEMKGMTPSQFRAQHGSTQQQSE